MFGLIGGIIAGIKARQAAKKREEAQKRANWEMAKREREAEAIRQQSVKKADEFRKKMPEYTSKAYEYAATPIRQQGQEKMQQTKSNLSSRGLLYGGYGQGKQLQQGAQTLGQLQGARVQAGEQTRSISSALDAAAKKQGLLSQQQRQEFFNKQYEQEQKAKDQTPGLLGFLGF